MESQEKNQRHEQKLKMTEMMRSWDMETVEVAVDNEWITPEEGEKLRELLNKVWDGRRCRIEANDGP